MIIRTTPEQYEQNLWTPPSAADRVGLTPRERDVLREVLKAKTNDEIALALGITTNCVKKHLYSTMNRTGTWTRLQLVVWSFNHGLCGEGLQ